MNQNGRHILALIRNSKSMEHSISVILNYLKFVNKVFNLESFYFMFSRSFRSKYSLVV